MRILFLSFFFCFISCIFPQDRQILSPKRGDLTTINNWQIFLIQNQNTTWHNTTPFKSEFSELKADTSLLENYKGVAWFSSSFIIDTLSSKRPLCLRVHIIGAAEIYINRKLVSQLGRVADSESAEALLNTSRYFIYYPFEPNKVYEVLVRYSNHELRASYNSSGENVFGFSMFIGDLEDIAGVTTYDRMVNSTVSTILFIFFLTLCLIHFSIFLFNRKEYSNLYYSIFCFLISALVLGLFGYRYTSYNQILEHTGIFVFVSPIFIFSIMPFMFRSFFKFSIPKWYKFIIVFGVFNVMAFVFLPGLSFLITLTLILFGSIEALRNLILAFKRKVKGVKIIGSGLLVFILTFIVSFITIYSLSQSNKQGGFIVFIFFLLAIFSIPASITIFLAYSISDTNKSLAKKLIEVEELSAKSIEQEKEKQHILENQNSTLEKQVTERTLEITAQKKIIEEKNKDIIDSINYAKRIQSAMLPEETEFKAIFNDSFILYQPRDIVSGDFYYATATPNSKLIVAADCTGHGVPGALMSMVGCNIINKITGENNIYDPKIILETLHTELRRALKQDLKGSVNRDGMDAAAVLITGNEVIYAGANRPLIYFNEEGLLNEIKATKTPIGGSHNTFIQIDQHVIDKNTIKELFLFSDGFADQFGGPDGKKLMVSKFKQWLVQISPLGVTDQHTFLSKEFTNWKKETEQVDDVMVIGIKI